MNRDQKINKLARAILKLRGKYDDRTGKWFESPQPARVADVTRWAGRLHLDVPETLRKVEGFKHVRDFEAWIKSLDKKDTLTA